MPSRGVKDQYEDFYDRSQLEMHIQDIIDEGGGISIENFVSASKKYIKDSGYHNVLNYKIGKTAKEELSTSKRTVGGWVWEKKVSIVEDIAINKIGWAYVAKGKKVLYKGKRYKPGQRLPDALKPPQF